MTDEELAETEAFLKSQYCDFRIDALVTEVRRLQELVELLQEALKTRRTGRVPDDSAEM